MTTQNIYEYNKIKPLDLDELIRGIECEILDNRKFTIRQVLRGLVNKINELTIEQNHLMKDFELYKKAFKRHHPDNVCDNEYNGRIPILIAIQFAYRSRKELFSRGLDRDTSMEYLHDKIVEFKLTDEEIYQIITGEF